MPYQPAVRGAETLPADAVKTASPGDHIYRLGGNSCLSGDYMGSWKFDHELQIGERIIFEDMILKMRPKHKFSTFCHDNLHI